LWVTGPKDRTGQREKQLHAVLEARQARYRVYTDLIDMAVCPVCAEAARSLGISVEQLDQV